MGLDLTICALRLAAATCRSLLLRSTRIAPNHGDITACVQQCCGSGREKDLTEIWICIPTINNEQDL